MNRLTAFLAPVQVRSFTQARAPVRSDVPVPEVGLRWGARSDFEFMLPEADREDRDGGGVVIIQPERRRTVDRVSRFSPAWRRYEVWRVRSPHAPGAHVDVAVTLAPEGAGRAPRSLGQAVLGGGRRGAIAGAADRLYVRRSAEIGSVGTLAAHVDESGADAMAGREWTL